MSNEAILSKHAQLAKLRDPFETNQISKLPKPTKQQTDAVRNDYKAGIRCKICGGWHHKDVVHLDYVGHAALTDRLLKVDPEWSWEPVAFDQGGLPAIDRDGGLWIRLTICGVTRYGYGDAQGKSGGDAMKERIGDALRNAAMRFGAALDLWHKGDLHGDDDDKPKAPAAPGSQEIDLTDVLNAIESAATQDEVQALINNAWEKASDSQQSELTRKAKARIAQLKKAA